MDDKKIVSELQKGNYKVFKYLYVHYRTIEKYVTDNSGHKEDAKDLFQNTLVIFYQMTHKPDFSLTANIGTLLYAIARRNWLKHITRKKEFSQDIAPDLSPEELPSEPQKDAFTLLKTILNKIGEPCKSLITLFHFDELNWDDIAAKLNYANAHAARQQKYKCFLKIRKSIPDHLQQEIIQSVS